MLGGIFFEHLFKLVESLATGRNILLVVKVLFQDHMGKAVQYGDVGSRPNLQKYVGVLRELDPSRICNNKLLFVTDDFFLYHGPYDRVVFSRVGSDHKKRLRQGDLPY